ncbi:MAG: hypothetical protein DRP79_04665 [Planctomycetota bacterium]|nr:MAG: hypothetical protein DRP79_04665 [Planctomycetota bacterium]
MVQWLKGEKNRAVEGWVSVMEGIRKGEIEFADMAGGVQPGALVWFAGVYMKNDELVEKAKKYLAKLAGRSRIEYWPGPVAKHILGKMGEQDVLDEAITRDEDIVDFDRKGRPKPRPPIMKDPRVKRKLCQANFYIGISRLARGDREGYAESLRACTKIPMPIELEYFLARGELEKVGEKVKR